MFIVTTSFSSIQPWCHENKTSIQLEDHYRPKKNFSERYLDDYESGYTLGAPKAGSHQPREEIHSSQLLPNHLRNQMMKKKNLRHVHLHATNITSLSVPPHGPLREHKTNAVKMSISSNQVNKFSK